MRVWGATAIVAAVLALFAPTALAAGPSAQATRVGPVPRGEQLQLVLPLNADLAGLQSFAQSVTTPGSPKYGEYESIPELAARFGAPPATSARVISYLRAVGATDVKLDATGLFVDATMSAPRAARVFTTPLAVFHSARAGEIRRADQHCARARAAQRPGDDRGRAGHALALDVVVRCTRPTRRARRSRLTPLRSRRRPRR